MDVVPGQGVDFGAVGDVLLLVLAIYVGASLLAWLQGYILNTVVQNTVRQMREDVEDEDQPAAAELLRPLAARRAAQSRVTNDIDNVSQTLQQTMSQLLTSLMTVVAVLAMMFWISPLLALVALVTVPLSLVVTAQIMKRSQGQFVAQWRRTGKLNAQIEEAFSGHALVKVFGRQDEVERDVRRGERRALQGQLRRPVRERADHAGDDVHREPQLRRWSPSSAACGSPAARCRWARCRRSSSTPASSPSR